MQTNNSIIWFPPKVLLRETCIHEQELFFSFLNRLFNTLSWTMTEFSMSIREMQDKNQVDYLLSSFLIIICVLIGGSLQESYPLTSLWCICIVIKYIVNNRCGIWLLQLFQYDLSWEAQCVPLFLLCDPATIKYDKTFFIFRLLICSRESAV